MSDEIDEVDKGNAVPDSLSASLRRYAIQHDFYGPAVDPSADGPWCYFRDVDTIIRELENRLCGAEHALRDLARSHEPIVDVQNSIECVHEYATFLETRRFVPCKECK